MTEYRWDLVEVNAIDTAEAKSLIADAERHFSPANRFGAFGIDWSEASRGTDKGAGLTVVLVGKAGRGRNDGQSCQLRSDRAAQRLVERRLSRTGEVSIVGDYWICEHGKAGGSEKIREDAAWPASVALTLTRNYRARY